MPQPITLLKVFVTVVVFVVACKCDTYAQITFQSSRKIIPDTSVVRKRFGRSALEFGLTEITPWSYDHFIAHKDYTDLTWKSTAYNLNPGHAQFDNDPFTTNQFGHPYHGSLFYNSFRANGYTFWQSVPAAFAGSYLWE